jgi:hypothetical protein
MAKTAISDLGTRIAVGNEPERLISALGNGVLKAGNVVGINQTTKKIQALNPGTLELGIYIVNGDGKTAIDTALPDGLPLSLIVPKSGHTYRVFIADQGGAKYQGQAMKPNASAVGELTVNTTHATAGCVASLSKDIADDDLVAEVDWL